MWRPSVDRWRLYERLGYAVLRDNDEPDDARGGFWEWTLVKLLG